MGEVPLYRGTSLITNRPPLFRWGKERVSKMNARINVHSVLIE